METKDRRLIVNYYTTLNGVQLTRDELGERIMNLLGGGSFTCGEIARTLKVTKQSIYNVMEHMMKNNNIVKSRNDNGIFEYRKFRDCLLAQLFYPSPEEIEKQFKIKGRQVHKTEQGRSLSSGSKGISPYQSSYLTSTLWNM